MKNSRSLEFIDTSIYLSTEDDNIRGGLILVPPPGPVRVNKFKMDSLGIGILDYTMADVFVNCPKINVSY